MLEDTWRIRTPEGVDLDVTLAGLGSRAIAGLVDGAIELAALLTLTLVVTVAGGAGSIGGGFMVAVFLVLVFLVLFAYDITLELANHGRTVGKMATGTQVVQADGGPVTFGPSVVRNLLRLVDGFSLVTYVLAPVGIIAILATRRNQRLGDLAAGTVVVRTRQAVPPAPADAYYLPDSSYLGWDVSAVGLDEVAMIRQFLARRFTLQPDARAALARDIATHVWPKVANADPRWHPEAFLEGVAAAKAARG